MGHDRACQYKSIGRRRRGAFQSLSTLTTFRQIRIQKAEHVRALDRANALGFLHVSDALVKRFHFGPMHFRPEMVFGVVAVVEKEPVVDFSVAAHAPGDWFVRVRAVVAIVTVQITETMAEIPERNHKEDHVPPVKEKHDKERGRERSELEVSPKDVAISAFA